MSKLIALKCKECGREFEVGALHVCEFCFGPLEAAYDYEFIKSRISREKIENGPRSLWRYVDLLPVERGLDPDFPVGFTPLQRATRLGEELGLDRLYLKNDSVNPTFSFKDRVVAVAVTKARELGYDTFACASTGNLASAVAAAGARAGMDTFVFLPSDVEAGKIVNAAIYGANIVAVDGTYDQLNRLCSEIADEHEWAFCNINVRPYYSEGSKTLAFETVEQLGWKAPDHVVVPIASGSLYTKITKGFRELVEVGLIENQSVRISGAQADGCSPVAEAYERESDLVRPVQKPETVAKSLAIGNPADGRYSLAIARETGGLIASVSDDEIIDGIRLLASTEGIFTETAGGVTVAVLKKLAEAGRIYDDELTVAYITGNGLKTQEALGGKVPVSMTIKPSYTAFEKAFETRRELAPV